MEHVMIITALAITSILLAYVSGWFSASIRFQRRLHDAQIERRLNKCVGRHDA